MRILIVDDNVQKAGKLTKVLMENGIARESIEIANCANGARECLKKYQYDLMILDLLLPLREENDPSLETSLHLVSELIERDIYLKPTRLVGFTAFDDKIESANEIFSENLWKIVHYDPTTNEWENLFGKLAQYLLSSSATSARREYDFDICVVTALGVEEDAVRNLPWNWEDPEPMDDLTFVQKGSFSCGSRQVRVVLACAKRMGCVSSALLSSKLISRYSPRFLVMTGICAGVKSKVELGDLVLFDPVWEWPSGKLSSENGGTYLEPAPHQIATSEFIVARMQQLQSDHSLWTRIYNSWPANRPATTLRLHIGPGASGSAVVADNATVQDIQNQHRKLTVVEMEAYGVCAAARFSASPKPTSVVMKAVCDFADRKKNDDWQKYACYVSAQGMAAFFSRYFLEVCDLAGT